MKMLVTGADRPFGRSVVQHLRETHEVAAVGYGRAPGLEGYRRVDLRAEDSDSDLLRGVQAIIHASAFDEPACPDGALEQEALARATLGTYRLCTAALEHGAERIVVISSLNCFDTLNPDWLVDEMWRPRPQPNVQHLAPFLCAESVREFVRAGGIHGICLRFASIGSAEDGTHEADALQGVDRALALPFSPSGYRWHVFHVASSRRFVMRDAVRILGFERKRGF